MSAWSAQQAQWLRALGYRVLVRREADWPATAAPGGTAAATPVPRAGAAPAPAPGPGPGPAVTGDAPQRAGAPSRTAPPRPRTEPARAPAPDPAPPPRTDASAKLVALTEVRREQAFNQPRYATLLQQLMRAAGLEGEAGRERLRHLGVDLPALHRDPAAKRALWPRLRGLRRQPRP